MSRRVGDDCGERERRTTEKSRAGVRPEAHIVTERARRPYTMRLPRRPRPPGSETLSSMMPSWFANHISIRSACARKSRSRPRE
ncbi:hypothetical protein BURKHO8Y_210526 [Burkholderia sp. 8Y]|nr:hypothetical protein BURKHO8Y_210526 [Burkholderia sp. 8Y]